MTDWNSCATPPTRHDEWKVIRGEEILDHDVWRAIDINHMEESK